MDSRFFTEPGVEFGRKWKVYWQRSLSRGVLPVGFLCEERQSVYEVLSVWSTCGWNRSFGRRMGLAGMVDRED